MSKPKTVIGIDLGSNCIKVVELKAAKAEMFLKRAGLIHLQDEPDFSPLQKSQLLVKKLAKLLGAINIKNASIITSVSGQSVLIRLIKLPPIPEGKIDQVIRYEAQQQVPFSLDEVVWDYHLLKRKKILEMEVLLVAIKTDLIKEVQIKLGSHLHTDIIDVSPLALYNCVRYNQDYLNKEGGVAIIDIGNESTDIVIFKKDDVWTRSFPIGGRNFTQALQKEFGLSYNEAEHIKKGGLEGYPQEEVKRVIRPIMEDLIVEIQHALGYYRSQVEGLTIDEIILSGGSSQLPSLKEFFAHNLGLELKTINPFKRIKKEPNAQIFVEDKWEAVESHQHLLGVAIGLALRGKVKCAVEINLLSQELLKRKIRQRRGKYILLTIIAFLIMLAGGMFLLHQNSVLWEKKLVETQELYEAEYGIYRPRIETLKTEESLLENKVQVMYQILAKKMLCLELLRAAGKTLTPEIWLDSFSFPRESERAKEGAKQFLSIKGKAASFEVINEFMRQLKAATAYINKIEPLASHSVKVDGKEFIEFSLEAELSL